MLLVSIGLLSIRFDLSLQSLHTRADGSIASTRYGEIDRVLFNYNIYVLFFLAAENEYNERLKLQPKQYSVDLVKNFMADRIHGQQHQLQMKLRQFFDYPEQFATKQHELPPSLRLIQSSEITGTENADVWG